MRVDFCVQWKFLGLQSALFLFLLLPTNITVQAQGNPNGDRIAASTSPRSPNAKSSYWSSAYSSESNELSLSAVSSSNHGLLNRTIRSTSTRPRGTLSVQSSSSSHTLRALAVDQTSANPQLRKTSVNSTTTADVDNVRSLSTTSNAVVAPFKFNSIPPAKSVTESLANFEQRRDLVLQWFAGQTYLTDPCKDEDNDAGNNCFLDSRTDARRLCDWAIANIILSLSVELAETILLDPLTVPFAITGTSLNKNDPSATCYRKGDYDFALIDFLHLVYVSRDYPGILSDEASSKIVQELLTLYGNDHDFNIELTCKILFVSYDYNFEDTENHVLMEEVAQYLTNQLLAELPENLGNPLFDNAMNGNNEFMLEYLGQFFTNHFYEYNSRPYQGYSVLALTLLNDYAADPEVALVAEMLLDVISGWSAVQTNNLRRFMPFRRQPEYIVPEEIEESQGWYSWRGDGEPERLSMLVGNYGYLEDLEWKLPTGDGLRHFILYAATTSYRMNNVLLDLALSTSPQFFVASHDTVEIYYSTPTYLISAGGIYRDPDSFEIDNIANVFSNIVGEISEDVNKEAGWAQPTTLVPTDESSADIRDMIKFQGHSDITQRSNTCVAPGFACGLSPSLGNKVQAYIDQCALSKQGSWLIFDLTTASSSTGCPFDYGLYVAYYERACDEERCSAASMTGTFGLLEVAEASSSLSFQDFASAVTANNPEEFASSGLQTYFTIAGDTIEFEVFPSERGLSSLVSVNGEQFGQDPRTWPPVRGNAIQSTTPGRYTFDSPSEQKRLVVDMTDPFVPRRLDVDLPTLTKDWEFGTDTTGTYFDDADVVVPGIQIALIEISFLDDSLRWFAMEWNNTLKSSHGDGSVSPTNSIQFADGEFITDVALGNKNDGEINYVRIGTNLGQEIQQGDPSTVNDSVTFPVGSTGRQIIAFYGHDSGSNILGMGVVYSPL